MKATARARPVTSSEFTLAYWGHISNCQYSRCDPALSLRDVTPRYPRVIEEREPAEANDRIGLEQQATQPEVEAGANRFAQDLRESGVGIAELALSP